MAKTKVLLVDDETTVCGEMTLYLNRKGYAVTAANNVEEALSFFNEERPDIVITDYSMPGRNGIDLLREIKARSPEIPVLMVSGQGDVKVVVEALKNEAFDFIPKPVNLTTLLETMSSALARVTEQKNAEPVAMKAIIHELVGPEKSISALRVHRPLDERIRQRLLDDMQNLTGKGTLKKSVMIVFKDVDYINNVGFNTIVEIVKDLKSRNVAVVCTQLSNSVHKYFSTLGYMDVLNVVQNGDDALNQLSSR